MLKMFYTDAKKLNWTRPYKHESGGYSVVCYNQDYDKDNPGEDTVEQFALCKDCALHELLCKFYKKNDQEGIMVVTKADDDGDSSSTSSENTT
jgi:hypothetical protein